MWCDNVITVCWCSMMLYNVMWFSVMSYIIRYGMVWCTVIKCGVVWYSVIMWSDDMAWWTVSKHSLSPSMNVGSVFKYLANLASSFQITAALDCSSSKDWLTTSRCSKLLHNFYYSTNVSTPHPYPGFLYPKCVCPFFILLSPQLGGKPTHVMADLTLRFSLMYFTMLPYYRLLLRSAKSRLIKIFSNKTHQQYKCSQHIYRIQINLTSLKLFLVRYLFGHSDKERYYFS